MVHQFFGFSIHSGYSCGLLLNTNTYFNGVSLKNLYLSILSRNDNFKNIHTLSLLISNDFCTISFAIKYGGLVTILSNTQLHSKKFIHLVQYTQSSVRISCEIIEYHFFSNIFDIAPAHEQGSNIFQRNCIFSKSFSTHRSGV
jgi:hypothetical protein